MNRLPVSFAFDIGTNSIGWSAFALDEAGRPREIIASGVRIFSSGTKGRVRARPAEERRMARSASRRRDRSLRRRKAVLRELIAIGLLPSGKEEYEKLIGAGFDRNGRDHLSIEDPYVLRARALHEKLSPYQIGRALFHLSKRRGRPSSQVRATESNANTLGEILAHRRVSRLPVRQAPRGAVSEGTGAAEPCRARQAVEAEFLRIWESQRSYGNVLLTEKAREKLFTVLFSEKGSQKPELESGARRAGVRRDGRREHHLLPPYPEILSEKFKACFSKDGRIANDVVHVALNQLRRVCNALTRRFGKPGSIALESTRCPWPQGAARAQREAERSRRQVENSRLDAQFLAVLHSRPQIRDTSRNRLKFRLWKELNPSAPEKRECIYTGSAIALDELFSPAVEIDHITPYSVARSNRRDNLTVCLSASNRLKGARRPVDCAEWADNYPAIEKRAAILPPEKACHFDPARRFLENDENAFMPGQIADTRRIAKFARLYLECLFSDGDDGTDTARPENIKMVPGRVTAIVRQAWGLDTLFDDRAEGGAAPVKNRNDYRQHAVDAMIIGVVPRYILSEPDLWENLAKSLPTPWDGFVSDVRKLVSGIIVSHKPDHGKARGAHAPKKGKSFARLHNDSAYGLTPEVAANSKPVIVRRKALNALRPSDICRIRDGHLRERLAEFTRETTGREFAARLIAFSREDSFFHGVRRIRLMEAADVIAVRDAQGRVCRAYKGNSNFRFDIWQLRCGRWVSEIVTTFDAHQPEWKSAIRDQHHNPKKIMSLKQQDMVAISDANGERRILRVVKFSRDGRICLAPHNEAGDLKRRDASRSDPFRYITMVASSMKAACARQIRIDELGTVFDPLDAGG